MVKAVALSSVQTLDVPAEFHRITGALLRAAKVRTHKPGTVLELPRALFEELSADGAVRAAGKDDLALAGDDVVKVPVPPAADGNTQADTDDDGVEYDKLSRADLDKLAAERGVDISKAQNKADVIAALVAADAA